jgi:hypothetical protein
VPFGPDLSFFRRQGGISYTASTQTYSIFAPNNVSDTFGPAHRDFSAPATSIAFAKPSRAAGTSRFAINLPSGAGAVHDFSRSAVFDTDGAPTSGTQIRTIGYCTLGVPTLVTDIPNTMIVNFTRFAIQGDAFDRRSGSLETLRLDTSLATMTVDVSAGVFVSVVRLIGTSASGAVRELGIYTVQGALDAETGGFSGSGSRDGPPSPGAASLAISGGFYGPQGKEFGYAFRLSQNSSPPPGMPSDVELSILGTVSGER